MDKDFFTRPVGWRYVVGTLVAAWLIGMVLAPLNALALPHEISHAVVALLTGSTRVMVDFAAMGADNISVLAIMAGYTGEAILWTIMGVASAVRHRGKWVAGLAVAVLMDTLGAVPHSMDWTNIDRRASDQALRTWAITTDILCVIGLVVVLTALILRVMIRMKAEHHVPS